MAQLQQVGRTTALAFAPFAHHSPWLASELKSAFEETRLPKWDVLSIPKARYCPILWRAEWIAGLVEDDVGPGTY